MRKPKKTRQTKPTTKPEKAPPAEEQAPKEPSPEDAVVREGARGAFVGGLLGGPGGAAVGGVFGLIGGTLWDDKNSRW